MFVTPAFAQEAADGAASGAADAATGAATSSFLNSPVGTLLPFIVIFVIMYFLLIRPQQAKARQHRELIRAVRRGDTVVTNGGLIGKVSKVVDDNELQIEIAEGTRVRVIRSMIADVRAKGEPVKDEAPKPAA